LSKTIAIDFDGVIHNQRNNWGRILGSPVDGAFDCIRTLIQKHPIYIFCARPWDDYPALTGLNYIPHWLDMHQLGIPSFADVDPGSVWEDKTRILVTNRKLLATVYIDDRGIRFESWPQTMGELVTRL